jgi:hypothetical protein
MNNLDLKFNIVPFEVEEDSNNQVIEATLNNEVAEEVKDKVLADFEESRKNLQNIVKVGATAVNDLGQYAAMSQSPEHYAALSSLIKNVSEVSSTLLRLHKQVEEIKAGSKAEKIETHNHLHVASTYEISKLLKKKEDDK